MTKRHPQQGHPRSFRLINIIASSIDGKIAHAPQESDADRLAAGFTSASDRRHLLAEMSHADAVIMGAETLRASPNLLLQKNQRGIYPPYFILTKRGLDHSLPFWRQNEVRRIIVSPEAHTAPPGTKHWENLVTGTEVTTTVIERYLTTMGCKQVLLFGGGKINHLFYQAGLVDELKLTLCPLLVGSPRAPALLSDQLPAPLSLSLIDSRREDGYLFLHYQIDTPSLP